MSGATHRLIAVYADESCLGNGRPGDNPGGAGALLEYAKRNGEISRRDLWVSEPSTTNNRMALRSVIETFRALTATGRVFSVVFTTDSRYLVDGMTEWVHGWSKRGWTRKGGAIENLALWHEALESIGEHEVSWRWVRGHDGHPQNEYANHLATRAAADQSSSHGVVSSDFEIWLGSRKVRSGIASSPDVFPHAADYRPARAVPRVGVRQGTAP